MGCVRLPERTSAVSLLVGYGVLFVLPPRLHMEIIDPRYDMTICIIIRKEIQLTDNIHAMR